MTRSVSYWKCSRCGMEYGSPIAGTLEVAHRCRKAARGRTHRSLTVVSRSLYDSSDDSTPRGTRPVRDERPVSGDGVALMVSDTVDGFCGAQKRSQRVTSQSATPAAGEATGAADASPVLQGRLVLT